MSAQIASAAENHSELGVCCVGTETNGKREVLCLHYQSAVIVSMGEVYTPVVDGVWQGYRVVPRKTLLRMSKQRRKAVIEGVYKPELPPFIAGRILIRYANSAGESLWAPDLSRIEQEDETNDE